MKLGLLVVLAVAVLVPSLSESRIVSKCELKEKLGAAISLPGNLERFREKILALVVCNVNRRSSLNTALVRVFGKRRPMMTVATTTIAPTTTTTTRPATTTTTTPATTTINATTTTTTATATATNATTTSPTPNTTTPGLRRRREAESMSEEDDTTKLDRSLGEMLSNEDRRTDDDESDANEEDEEEEDESDEGDEDEQEENGKRKKQSRPKKKRRPSSAWSLGYYGIFQLFDSLFCDSGYRSSRNVCRTSCTAFTDDNIMDDIACFVRSGYW
ncbi:hypothetical protein L3Q82_020067, partial [Scortum barcoo]